MKSIIATAALTALALIGTAAAETYQATGPVLEVTESKIVIQKTKATKWEFARNASTKVKGDLKVGSTVTVYYNMTAVSTEEKIVEKEDTKAEKTEKAPKKTATPEKPAASKKKAS